VAPETSRVAVDFVDKGMDRDVDRSVDEKHQSSESSALLSTPLSTKSTLSHTRPDSSLRFGMTNSLRLPPAIGRGRPTPIPPCGVASSLRPFLFPSIIHK
jgi:hypothetical protein